jgi:hypothetical protein
MRSLPSFKTLALAGILAVLVAVSAGAVFAASMPPDISGPCDEAEHADDPECTGAPDDDSSGPGSGPREGDDDNSGPGDGDDHEADGDEADDDNSGPGGGDREGGNDDNSGPGGGDDD